MAIALSEVLTVLLVVAHPDDETLFGGFIYVLTHKLNASVDLMCVTNAKVVLDRQHCLDPSVAI
jgi:LmbE family N-acetylglucosaminyl deacetylase